MCNICNSAIGKGTLCNGQLWCNGLSMETEGQTRSHLDSQQRLLLLLPAMSSSHVNSRSALKEIYFTIRQILNRQTDKYHTDRQTEKQRKSQQRLLLLLPAMSSSHVNSPSTAAEIYNTDKYQTDKQTNTKQTDGQIPKKISTEAATAPACHVFLSCQLTIMTISIGGNICYSQTNTK